MYFYFFMILVADVLWATWRDLLLNLKPESPSYSRQRSIFSKLLGFLAFAYESINCTTSINSSDDPIILPSLVHHPQHGRLQIALFHVIVLLVQFKHHFDTIDVNRL